jgi:predicted kinase
VNRFVVISGLPASGKSAVAKVLAQSLGLPLLDKDAFLEALFQTVGIGDTQWRRELSHRADGELQRLAMASESAVLTSWWKHPQSSLSSGTPIEWLATLPGVHVEVHCSCSPAVAAKRFLARRRHPGHLDGRWSYPELLANFSQQASFGPLGFGRLIEVQTEGPLEITALLRDIEHVFMERAQSGGIQPLI